VGLLLGLAMGALVVHGFSEQLGRRRASGLVSLLVPLGLWDLAFGPLSSNVPTLTLALGLVLVTRCRPGDRPGQASDAVAAAGGAGPAESSRQPEMAVAT
jgi:hypothetical protein